LTRALVGATLGRADPNNQYGKAAMRLATNWMLVICFVLTACGGGGGGGGGSGGSTPAPDPTGAPTPGSPPAPPPEILQRVIFWREIGDNVSTSQRYLYAVNENGTGVVAVSEQAGRSTYKATAPNGKIVFETFFVAEGQTDLFSINPDGTELRNLTGSAQYESFNAVTSESGIIFTRNSGNGDAIYDGVYKIASSGEHMCTIGDEDGPEQFIMLTSDDRVIFRRCSSAFTECTIQIGDCSGTTVLDQSDDELQVYGVTATNRLVYSLGSDATQEARLLSVKLDGTDRQCLATTSSGSGFDAAVRGGSVVYGVNEGATTRNFYVVDAAVGGPVVLASDVGTAGIARGWTITPAGRFVYSSGRSDGPPSVKRSDLHSVELDGTDRKDLATTPVVEVLDELTNTGRVLYQRYPRSQEASHGRQLRSVLVDGTDDVLLADATSDLTRFTWAEAVTETNRVLYVDFRDSPWTYDVHAIDETGANRQYLYSLAQYGGSTVNDRIIYTAPCTGFIPARDAPNWSKCIRSAGDVLAVKSDGTGLIPLANGSEREGLEALYDKP
jgi:hypothetical protein